MFTNAIHPDDRTRIEGALRRAILERATYDEEYRIVRRDGSLRWIAGKGRAYYDAAGMPVRMTGVALDITDRKRAHEEASRREAQFAEAQRIAHLGSYEWDIGTDHVYRSEELCRIFGLAPEQFPPTFQGYLERVHPDDRGATRTIIETANRESTPFELGAPDSAGRRQSDGRGPDAFKEHGVANPIRVCRDGEEALRYMEAHDSPTDSRLPILVLLDLRLPKVDGIDVLRQARSHPVWKQVPFVVLTTSRENSDVGAAYGLGANSYIVKPVDFGAFVELVKTIKVYWLLTNETPFPEDESR